MIRFSRSQLQLHINPEMMRSCSTYVFIRVVLNINLKVILTAE